MPKRKRRRTAIDIQHELDTKGRNIVLDQTTYVNTYTKARFIDPEFGEWWAKPNLVLRGSGHPKRYGNQRCTAQEINDRLRALGRNVVLDESTYINLRTKARFIDPEFGEWWAQPNNVLHGSEHPRRAYLKCLQNKKRLTPQQIQERLDQQQRNITLDASTYVNTHTKARFVDLEFGEWWATPNAVLQGRDHPKRGRLKNIQKQKRLTAQQVQERLNKEHRAIFLDSSTYVHTHVKARFIDPEFGEWWAKPNSVLNGSGHAARAGNMKLTAQQIQERLDQQQRNIILDASTYVNTHTKARFIDPEFGEWWAKPNNVLQGSDHPKRFYCQNKLEIFVAEQLGIKWIGDQKIDHFQYKPDFKLNDKIYLNVDGLYWHSEECRERDYHFKMRQWFEERGMRILQFRENEIRDKWHIVKGIVDAITGASNNKVGARNCELIKLKASECFEFYEQWHLKGGIRISGYGLRYKDELIAAISVKCVQNVLKVERFCVKAGWSVSGGYSKLLNRVLQDYQGIVKVQSWVDLRYGDGHSLEKMGFVKVKDTLGWEWTDFKTTYNRLQCRANMDERGLSEREHAEELGWVRIYDAGQRLFEKRFDVGGIF